MRVATVVLLAFVSGLTSGPGRAQDLDPAESPDNAPAAPDSPDVERMQAIGICEQTVAERLENPSAAHWADRSQYRVARQGPGQFAIDGFVDVQGALGDMRTPWMCRAIRGYGNEWQAIATLGEAGPTAPQASTAPPPVSAERVRPPVPDVPAAAAPPPAAAPHDDWSPVGSCRRLRVVDAYAEKYPDKRLQVVKGTLEYSGSQPIRNVRVCASGTCKAIRGAYPPLQNGAREPFVIEVPTLETVTVTAECSTLAENAGP